MTTDDLLLGIAEPIANLQLPDPDLRQHYLDEENRVFWIDCEIDDRLLDLVKMIIRCNQEDKDIDVDKRKPIRVFISSVGGETSAMWSTMNAIQTSKTPVYTYNFCYAYSAAAEILISGQKRFAFKGSTTMIHSGTCVLSGERSAVESAQKFMNAQEKKYQEFLLSHTRIDPKVYKKRASSDMYYDEYAALEAGIVDEIIEDFDILY